jgi:AraC family transcriptional regulator
MDPVGKALWYIESHFSGGLTLEEIAGASGVSRFHLARAFGEATGRSVMTYVRGRRLTEAARALASGNGGTILGVALDAGYGSHEAFTRAFRDQFGLTPEAVRGRRLPDDLLLVEPIKMDETLLADLAPPRLVSGAPLLIAGLGERYTCETSTAIPAQWQRFLPHFGNVPGQVGRVAYGVCCNSDGEGSFDYVCGVEVTGFSDLPPELTRVRIPAQRYAVFPHLGHISTIRRTISTIWGKWLPASGHEAADAPDFERYGEDFDPQTGMGTVEIWIPIKD